MGNRKFGWAASAALPVLGLLASLGAGSARADDRSAEKILGEIQAVQMPQPTKADQQNQAALRVFIAKRQAAMERKANLIGELYQKYPDNAQLPQLLPERWQALLSMPKTADEAIKEVDRTIARNSNEELVQQAMLIKVVIAFTKGGQKPKFNDLMPQVDQYTKRFPKDPRGAEMLSVLGKLTDDSSTQALLTARIEREYPDSPVVQAMATERRIKEAVGKPFPIDFTDATTGTPVNAASLKGKVVVVDFWATWCGPCVAEMPKMKDLYAKYRDKGVEFVGISLDSSRDQGGFDKLKAFVADNKIPWPQFYQGNGWESEFSRSWGINSIPAVFIVDAAGNLASTEARGRLEEMIPELLAKAGHPAESPPAPADKPKGQ